MCNANSDALFTWREYEQGIGNWVLALHFAITSSEPHPEGQILRGTVTCRDCIEGCTFTDNWIARQVIEDGPSTWIVLKTWDNGDKEGAFFPGSDLDYGLRRFIVNWINYFQSTGKSLVEPPTYAGPIPMWKAECVCLDLEYSSPAMPFDWEAHVEGPSPKRCFVCSCGTLWWCDCTEHKHWVRVADPLAWKNITEHDGCSTKQLGRPNGEIWLFDTLVTLGIVRIL